MGEDLAQDSAEITASKGKTEDIKVNVYGLLTVAAALGQLPFSYPSPPSTQPTLTGRPTLTERIPAVVIQHAILLLLKMGMDMSVGEDLHETIEASLSTLLQSLDDTAHTSLISLLTQILPEKHIQVTLLSRLPIQPIRVAQFRQNLAKSFLAIPLSPPSALIECLRSQPPFTLVNRDISNEDVRQLRYATQIYEVAFGWFPAEQNGLTKEVIREFKGMNKRILDERASSIARTETKDVIQRVWMTMEHTLTTTHETTHAIEQFWG